MIRVEEKKWINLDRVTEVEVSTKYNGREHDIKFYFDDNTVERIGSFNTEEEAIKAAENILKEN